MKASVPPCYPGARSPGRKARRIAIMREISLVADSDSGTVLENRAEPIADALGRTRRSGARVRVRTGHGACVRLRPGRRSRCGACRSRFGTVAVRSSVTTGPVTVSALSHPVAARIWFMDVSRGEGARGRPHLVIRIGSCWSRCTGRCRRRRGCLL